MLRSQLLLLFLVTALSGQQAAPELSISANGAMDLDLYQGWPLIVHTTIQNSQRFSGNSNTPPLIIAPPGGAWTDAIQFTVVSSSGQTSQWDLTLVGSPADPALTLQSRSYLSATWQMSGDTVASLTPDTYQLSASLQVANSTGWNGGVQSRPITIRVGAEPGDLTPEQQSDKVLSAAEYALNAGDMDSALTGVAALVQSQPNNHFALAAAADILERGGCYEAGLFEASAAVQTYSQNIPASTEMPAAMLTMLQRLLTEALTPDAGTLVEPQNARIKSSTRAAASGDLLSMCGANASSGGVPGGTALRLKTDVPRPSHAKRPR